MQRIILASVIVSVLLQGSCSSTPQRILLFEVQPIQTNITELVVWLCLNDKPAHEGALKIASEFDQFAISVKSEQAIGGTLSVEVDALDANGTPIGVGLSNMLVSSDTTSLAVPITLISPVSRVGCSSGMCLTCTPPMQLGCQLSPCASGGCCDPDNSSCVMSGAACSAASTLCADGKCTSCGELSQPCCAGGMACFSTSTICADGICASCGELGQPCCADGVACSSTSTVCTNGQCTTCGGPGQPCCAGGTCSASGCCDRGAIAIGQCVAQGSRCAGGTTACLAGLCF